jgi:hypothetical protein
MSQYKENVKHTSQTVLTQENIDNIIINLSESFSVAMIGAEKIIGHEATRIKTNNKDVTTKLYDIQVDFAHIIQLIKMSPLYNVKYHILAANDLIMNMQTINQKHY